MPIIRFMIVDDPSIMREGLKLLLNLEDGFHVVGESDHRIECLHMLSELNPDILILNLCMSEKSGFDILSKLNQDANRKLKVLILTDSDDVNFLSKSMEIGIDGYLLKSAKVDELKKAIYFIMNGETYIQSDLISILNDRNKYISKDIDKIHELTNRELDVLKNLTVGMYNKEIALKLNISERTVKNHISSIFKKIGVSDRTQAAIFSIRNNLIDIYN